MTIQATIIETADEAAAAVAAKRMNPSYTFTVIEVVRTNKGWVVIFIDAGQYERTAFVLPSGHVTWSCING